MVAPDDDHARALLAGDGQLLRRISARQYQVIVYRRAPGAATERTFMTTGGHPVGWHRRQLLNRLFAAGLAYADDDLVVVLTRRSLWLLLSG